MILYPSLFTGLVVAATTVWFGPGRLRQILWVRCPAVPATIASASVRPADQSAPHVGYVIYRYRAKSQEYSGLCARTFATHQEAQKFVKDHSTGRLTARYKPERPEESRLFLVGPESPQGDVRAGLGRAGQGSGRLLPIPGLGNRVSLPELEAPPARARPSLPGAK